MRRLAILLLLAAAVPVTAQQPEITGFGTNGFVTWTNPDTNAYYAIDWTWNLNYNWIEMDSMARATQALMHASVWDVGDPSVAIEQAFIVLRDYAQSMGDTTDALFVRIRTSTDPPWCGSVTNWLRACNASTSVLENVAFGIEFGTGNRDSAGVSLLPSGSNTAFNAFGYLWPAIFHPWSAEVQARRYFITYTQAGAPREFVTETILPLGPPRKELTFIVSNTACSVRFEWLPRGHEMTKN